ncbi:MAG: trypsin-like serine protease [Azospirillum sp.]|nr:trypsin-like serine protease [Azospirillum sp.]
MAKAVTLGIVLVLSLSGCLGFFVPEPAPTVQFVPPPAGARVTPLRFGRITAALRHGTEVGDYQFGLLCAPPYNYLTWGAVRKAIEGPVIRDLFVQTLSDAGYDVAGDSRRLYDEDEDLQRAELVVSAEVVDLDLALCSRVSPFFLVYAGEAGEATIKIAWTVYSRLLRRPVYRTTTTGRAASNHTRFDAPGSFTEEAFGAAAAALAAEEGFRAVGFALDPVDAAAVLRGPERRSREPGVPAQSDAAARRPLTLARRPPNHGLMRRDAGAAVGAVVLIAGGSGHGSGFFIGEIDGGGLILTNAHVVGDAERLRVTLADNSVEIGTVLRRHPVRDAALIRIDRPPPMVLPIREKPVVVGEDVYAIGAPLYEKLRGTVTRGIVSALRREPVTRLPEIQADVAVYGGNSGGPLVDADGNVVGFTVGGFVDRGVATELNIFIPIIDALQRLQVGLAPKGLTPKGLTPKGLTPKG